MFKRYETLHGATWAVETDPQKMAELIREHIEKKRDADLEKEVINNYSNIIQNIIERGDPNCQLKFKLSLEILI